MRTLVTCLLLALSLPASAQIYSYTDANGQTVFTNEPPLGSNAQSVDLPPTNGASAPAINNTAPDNIEQQSNPPARYNVAPLPQTITPTDHSIDEDNGAYDYNTDNDNDNDNDRLRRDERGERRRR